MVTTEQPLRKRLTKKTTRQPTNTTQPTSALLPKLSQENHPLLPKDIPLQVAEPKSPTEHPTYDIPIAKMPDETETPPDPPVPCAQASVRYEVAGTRLQPGEHKEYEPVGGIASGFNTNCHPITLEHLIQQDEKESEDTNTNDNQKELTADDLAKLTATPFLFTQLLGISKAQADTKIDFTTFKKQKRGKMQTSYKHKYLFASLNDKSLMTCVILEKNNDEHNVHWTWNQSKQDVTIGIRLAIQNPRLVGYLPTQSAIIETKLPFIMLSSPAIRPAPIVADTTSHVMKYFVLKQHKITMVKDHLPVPWKTSCNASFCDRLAFKEKHNTICGCWGAFSKNDSTTRNTVLQFDFKFQANGKLERVNNYTSLRTSRLFFAGERIIADVEALTIHENTRVIQEKFLKTMHYINNNGGWTIVGWYIRGQKQNEEHKEDNEESLLSEGDVKINVSYLYPTTIRHKDIPVEYLFQQKDLYIAGTPAPGPMDSHNV